MKRKPTYGILFLIYLGYLFFVPAFGAALNEPDIQIIPDGLDFGTHASGSWTELSLEIRNAGDADLELTSFMLSGSDPDQFDIISGGQAGILIPGTSQNLVLAFSPTSAGIKSATLMIHSNDPDENPCNIDLSGTALPANTAPVISIPGQVVYEGESFGAIYLDLYVEDDYTSDYDIYWEYWGFTELDVVVTNRICHISIPDEDWYGSETVTFRATDNSENPLSSQDIVIFTVLPVNDAPVMTQIPDQTLPEGDDFSAIFLDQYVHDIETADSNIFWTFSGNEELTVDITDRIVRVQAPDSNWYGTDTIIFTGRDNDSVSPLSCSDTVCFRLDPVNDPPVITGYEYISLFEDDSISLLLSDLSVEDVDNPPDSITLLLFPGEHYTLMNDQMIRPDADFNGVFQVIVAATDGLDTGNRTEVNIHVLPVNDPPVVHDIPNQTVTINEPFQTINLDIYVEDVETPDSNITWMWTTSTELIIEEDDHKVSVWPPYADWIGSDTIWFIATDADSLNPLSAGTEVIFKAICVFSPPVLADIPDQYVEQGNAFGPVLLSAYVSDPDTPVEDISWAVSGNEKIRVDILNDIAYFYVEDDTWTGTEILIFKATDSGPCASSAWDEVRMTVLEADGLCEHGYSGIQVYPNPTSGDLNLVFPEGVAQEADIRIMNAGGETISSQQHFVYPDGIHLDLSRMHDGLYILRIRYGSEIIMVKVFLQTAK